ncbi:transcriptional regulator [Paenibacillus sp. VTT E-133280]|jgi:Rrf2 family protein|uniref:Transcriptional regulator n=1 Tax=Paenibacillus odorifer TaxID=189426 RepID=A0A1R0Y4E6_9BACL|nr:MULTISPECIES: Rrf2 family transcriptional regulator [Paenibacillus]MBY3620681.1 Rrf2 family transcriptional regulator [Acinetobacter sp. CUI P1]AIQ23831.1 Rrf2 family transcriptional regulator [Paenibacillus sp. FSL H7-0737]AIQ35700.1 Rrf2 family transcriptional regulator [Paenibacillus sp. FSL R5-0345]KAA1191525.1 Rrf2 family transcriptional regulator [Paenibacillus sp. B2(2019)]MDH6368590.1 Rrf2 family protein [Paenibacillus sp. PastF-3]
MKYSQATDYALHAMLYLVTAASDKPVGVQLLAEKLGVSQTYLSKMMTKLVKAGLIQSAPGANGGYRLRRKSEEISFLDIIHAIEGTASLFECSLDHGSECLIQQVVIDAERQMEQYLENKKIADLAKTMKTE